MLNAKLKKNIFKEFGSALGWFVFAVIIALIAGWPIFSPEPSYIKPEPPEGLWSGSAFTAAILFGVSLVIHIIQAAFFASEAKSVVDSHLNTEAESIKSGLKKILNQGAITFVMVQLLVVILQYFLAKTCYGTFNYWLFDAVVGWGTIGIILIVVLSIFFGLLPGFAAALLFFCYIVYRDVNIINYMAIPALIADIVEGIGLMFAARFVKRWLAKAG